MNFALQFNFARQSFMASMVALTMLPAESMAQEDGLRPLRGLRTSSYWELNWPWIVGLSFVVVFAIVLLSIWLIKRQPPAKRLTPAEEARLRLGEASQLSDGRDDKAFSITVSDALRRYLERAFGLRAPEQTTEEFLQSARRSGKLPAQSLETLARFLELCDLAKFAQHAFGDDERRELLNAARNFVDEAEQRNLAAPKQETTAP